MGRIYNFFEELYYHETSESSIKRDWLILFGVALSTLLWGKQYNIYEMKSIGIVMLIILGLTGFIMVTLKAMNTPSKTQAKSKKILSHN